MAMFRAIREARERVWVQTYTLEPDAIGMQVIKLLEEAAARHCDVRLLYDSVGSYRMDEVHFERLRRLGGSVTAYQPIPTAPWRWSLSYFNRNHRKLLLVDDDLAFCGGMNLSADYAGSLVGGNGYFADVKVRDFARKEERKRNGESSVNVNRNFPAGSCAGPSSSRLA